MGMLMDDPMKVLCSIYPCAQSAVVCENLKYTSYIVCTNTLRMWSFANKKNRPRIGGPVWWEWTRLLARPDMTSVTLTSPTVVTFPELRSAKYSHSLCFVFQINLFFVLLELKARCLAKFGDWVVGLYLILNFPPNFARHLAFNSIWLLASRDFLKGFLHLN